MKNSEQALIDAVGNIADALRNQEPTSLECKTMPLQMQIAMRLLASSIQGQGVESLNAIRGDHIDQAMSLGWHMVRSERRDDQD